MPSKTSKTKTKTKSSKDKSSKKKTKTSKKTKKAPVEEVVDVTQVEAPKKAKKAKTKAKKEVPQTSNVEDVVDAKPVKKRRQVDRESVIRDFDSTISLVEAEIENIRSATDSKSRGGVKFLRSLNKGFKQLKKDTIRAMKQKRRNPNRPI